MGTSRMVHVCYPSLRSTPCTCICRGFYSTAFLEPYISKAITYHMVVMWLKVSITIIF